MVLVWWTGVRFYWRSLGRTDPRPLTGPTELALPFWHRME